jgi:Family of unknown function (DUF6161)
MLGRSNYHKKDNMNFSTPITLTDVTGKSWSFNSNETLIEFVKKEIDFWAPLINLFTFNQVANSYIQRYSNFQQFFYQLNQWAPNFETWDANTTYSQIIGLVNSQISTNWVWSNHPFIHKWLELNEKSNSNIADAFFEAIVLKTTSRITGANSFEFYQGYLIAYEYINQNKTEINKRRNSEVKSLTRLRDELVEKHNELTDEVGKFQNNLTKWKDNTETKVSDWLVEKNTCLDETVLVQSKNFHEQLANWTEEKTNLANLYQEKLRLDPSVQYWTASAEKLNKQGLTWARTLVFSILFGFVTFAIFFIFWLKGDKTALSLQSLEGVILFATILSCYAFLLKSVSKAMFSSFHLQRVSEESALLTNLYLSLKEGKDDDPESRKIILQALFSRSETGLLSGEHGPTMPSVNEFINIIGKSK